jgi:uncharacterized protein
MKRVLMMVGLVALGAGPVWAQASSPVEPVVVVHGDGLVRRAPDRALVRIGAESRSRAPKEAQAASATAMTAVQEKLLAAGLPREALRTVVLSLQQEFDYTDGKQTPRGYVARHVIEARVDDLAILGDVLDASVGAGATSVHGLEFGLKQRAAVEREALTLAVADALARADAAAGGARRAVDRILRIEEGAPISVVRPQAMMDRQMMSAAPATPVVEGEIEIRAQVVVTASLK